MLMLVFSTELFTRLLLLLASSQSSPVWEIIIDLKKL